MRHSTGLMLAGLWLAGLTCMTAASAQAAEDTVVKAIDRAGETAATKGAPGTVVPDAPGAAVAPGIESPVATPVRPADAPKPSAPAAK